MHPSLATPRRKGPFYKARTNLEGLFGVYSKWHLFRSRALLELSAGYEISLWFRQNELSSFASSNISSATSLIGLDLTGLSTVSLFGTSALHLAVRGLTFNVKYSF